MGFLSMFAKESEALEQTISGFGVDEQAVLEIFMGLKIEDINRFRSYGPRYSIVDGVERCKTIADYDAERMQAAFLHFHKAVDMWSKHSYQRDANLIRSAFEGQEALPTKILAEVICTRDPAELVRARYIYKSMYGIHLEEQLETYTPQTLELKLLRTILLGGDPTKSYKAKNELKAQQKEVRGLFQSLRDSGENRAVELITNETINYIDMVLREQYQLVNNAWCEQDVVNYEMMKVILKCRRDPVLYFLEVLDDAFEGNDVDALTRVIVTCAESDEMTEIKKVFLAKHGISLRQKIESVAKGYYKDFILMLLEKFSDD